MSSKNKGISRREFITKTTAAALALTGAGAVSPGTVQADKKNPSVLVSKHCQFLNFMV